MVFLGADSAGLFFFKLEDGFQTTEHILPAVSPNSGDFLFLQGDTSSL